MNTTFKILLFIILILGCKKDDIKTKGIEFYLPESTANINRCKDFNFDTTILQATPIITDADVINYNWSQHTITLSERAYNELKENRNNIGSIFPMVFSLNGEKIYGFFYKYAILSSSCQSTLMSESNLVPTNGKLECRIVHGQGYDASAFVKDPRGDKRIYDYLKSTNRLVE